MPWNLVTLMASVSPGPSCDTPSILRSFELLLFCGDGIWKPSVRGPTFLRAVAIAHAVSYAHKWNTFGFAGSGAPGFCCRYRETNRTGKLRSLSDGGT
uniref:Uncharacterized protein n=1 Tax=Arundo donax TaxID=35708 RepID=A0A0A9A4P8_ARUDO